MPTVFYSNCDPDSALARMAMRNNFLFLSDWEGLFPDDAFDVDEDSFVRSICAATALGRGEVATNLGIIFQLKLMPKLFNFAKTTLCLDRRRLVAIERACIGVKQELLPQLDREIVELLTPTRPNQAMMSARMLSVKIREIVCRIDPPAAEREPQPNVDSLHISHFDGGCSRLECDLRPDEAMELDTILKTVARRDECTKGEALLRLVRQQTTATVVFNVYGQSGKTPVCLGGSYYLDITASKEWGERVTITRKLDDYADATSSAYEIPETIKALVKGRDGCCRFPGCGTPAEQCDIDHVVPFAEGGATTAANLQCLCRRCHNLKTDRMALPVINADASVTWRMPDGTTTTTVPQGPVPPKVKERKSRWSMTLVQRRDMRIEYRRKLPL